MAYGAWIEPSGKLIDDIEKFQHNEYVSYQDAHKEGWVGIVYCGYCWDTTITPPRMTGMCVRLNPKTATKAAIRTAIRLVSKSDEPSVYVSDIFTGNFKDHYNAKPKREAVQFLRDIMNGDITLKGRFE